MYLDNNIPAIKRLISGGLGKFSTFCPAFMSRYQIVMEDQIPIPWRSTQVPSVESTVIGLRKHQGSSFDNLPYQKYT